MKKVSLLILVSLVLVFALASCGLFKSKECEHAWTAATCQAPKTCTLCGATEGTSAAHKVDPATCTEPQKCSVCGYTSELWQTATGHNWKEATCFTADWEGNGGTIKTCWDCGATEGEAPVHTVVEATCTESAYCSVCLKKDKDSPALDHDYQKVDAVEPTCTTMGKTEGVACTRCGDIPVDKNGQSLAQKPLDKKAHTEATIEAVPPTCEKTGLSSGVKCSVCDNVLDAPVVIPALGHEVGEYMRTIWPAKECQQDGTTYFKCAYGESCDNYSSSLGYALVIVTEPKIPHDYEGQTCDNPNAECKYCKQKIQHEYSGATCLESSKCIICGEVEIFEGVESTPLGHTYSDPSCGADQTCIRCGIVMEGSQKLSHVISFNVKTITYSCSGCDATFKPVDESYYLSGNSHAYMHGAENADRGFTTHVDNGKATNQPAIMTDEKGNKYYALIKDKAAKEGTNPQLQLWIPMMRAGFSGFNSTTNSVGFLSFKINAYVDYSVNDANPLIFQFVEGGGWDAGSAITEPFFKIASTPPDEDPPEGQSLTKTFVTITGWDTDFGCSYVIEEGTPLEDRFSGWLDVQIGIVLDSETDTITLYYYLNGEYVNSASRALTTANNGIKCVYMSAYSDFIGSGVMLDDIAFGYTQAANWSFDASHEHSYTRVVAEVLPTCVDDGYVVYGCSGKNCTSIGYRETLLAYGHDIERIEALAPTCTEDGYTESSKCLRCHEVFKESIVLEATGHAFDENSDDYDYMAPTCKSDGWLEAICLNCNNLISEEYERISHEYSLDAVCGQKAVCIHCNKESSMPIEHVFAPATCTDPATCMRTGCTETDGGEPLGHKMSEATCALHETCTVCGYVDEQSALKSHKLNYKKENAKPTFYCANCDAKFIAVEGYFHDGNDHKNMTGNDGNKAGYTVEEGTHFPKIVDGHYEAINTNGGVGTQHGDQLQLWIPKEDAKNYSTFSSANKAVGFFAFRISAKLNTDLTFQLVEGPSNYSEKVGGVETRRWTEKAVAGKVVLSGSNGSLSIKVGGLASQTDMITIQPGSDGFTPWTDICIGIVLDDVADQLTYHFYANGEHLKSFSINLTVDCNSINGIYLEGKTKKIGDGIKLDDIVFAWTPVGEWVFDDCDHDYGNGKTTNPTCTQDGFTKKTCSKCNHIVISDQVPKTGHTQEGIPTCTADAKCKTCGEVTKSKLGHEFGDSDCTSYAVCMRDGCGAKSNEKGPHMGGLPTCTEEGICTTCGNAYLPKTAHTGGKATCQELAVCVVCNNPYGEYGDHFGGVATCIKLAVCTIEGCGKEYGDFADHVEGTPATCMDKAICKICEEPYGDFADHVVGTPATCTTQAICKICEEPYGEIKHTLTGATCTEKAHCTAEGCEYEEGSLASHSPVLEYKYVDGYTNKLPVYSCKWCEAYYVLRSNSYYLTGTPGEANVQTNNKDIVSGNGGQYELTINEDGYQFVLDDSGSKIKSWLYVPTNSTSQTSIKGFSSANNAVGVLSFSADVYNSEKFEVFLVDMINRDNHLGDFWNKTTQEIMLISPPDEKNVVTISAYTWVRNKDGNRVKTVHPIYTVQVSDENKYTGMIDFVIGIELSSDKETVNGEVVESNRMIKLHYYINGQYVATKESQLTIVTGKIRGAMFNGISNIAGSGIKIDDVFFGYGVDSKTAHLAPPPTSSKEEE